MRIRATIDSLRTIHGTVPRRHSADAWSVAKPGVEKVSTRHVENVRHVNFRPKGETWKLTALKAVGLD